MNAEELVKSGIDARIAGDEETFLRVDGELQADPALASTSIAKRYHDLVVAACGAALMLASTTGCAAVDAPQDVYAGPPERPVKVVQPRPLPPPQSPPPQPPVCIYAGPPAPPVELVPPPPVVRPPVKKANGRPPLCGYKGPQYMRQHMVPGPGPSAPGPRPGPVDRK